MENWIFVAVAAAFLLFVFGKGMWDNHKELQLFREKLKKDYGKRPERKYNPDRFARIDGYFRNHPKDGQLDDITWNDLNMDEVFKRMNYTFSSAGEEYLYYTLRTPRLSEEELLHQEEAVRFFTEQEKIRVEVLLWLRRLGTTAQYSLYDYLEYLGALGNRSNVRILLQDFLFLPLIVLCFIQLTPGLIGILVLLIYNIITYYREKKEIDPYITSFAYIVRLLNVCDGLLKLKVPPYAEEWENIRQHAAKLGGIRRSFFWIGSGSKVNGTGNPLEILLDYVRMVFHLDIAIFNRMLRKIKHNLEDVDVLVTEIGKTETAICIGAYRACIRREGQEYCLPQLYTFGQVGQVDGTRNGHAGGQDDGHTGEKDGRANAGGAVGLAEGARAGEERLFHLEEAYHPLIDAPVKNSIRTDRGVLLTGSNASGKSTFLKTVALNAVLAQTIYTCTADCYRAPFFRIYSSMALKDDLAEGESYYIVEIKSLKRILDASALGQPVLCFVDEVLRGTNTVERIAASTQILHSLAGKNILCFAATHDIELTRLLEKEYDNYHFEEEIKNGDILFPYKLLSGRSTTRNAIRLLEIMGYDEEIIRRASDMARHFVETGQW